ncbi:C40 family peptidase [Levilactobacillus suantsaii]|uniref:NlpC/P60 family protein n=1 Tax=Levilactobacillus suantsaii TaxID=2292255 RepID=A0A4Q0VK57_9LACO|nr:C40 family peptidase [Levilactobacillus suantsaii]QMU07449.1 C40 family peptidase [Levilactobacillus suantsaii]RXI79251.1 NlpC/P60 family protein [Levilactobacillus suantsaii]
MEIRRVKVPTALVWAKPVQPQTLTQALLAGQVAPWLAQLSLVDQEQLADQQAVVTEVLFNDQVVLDQIQDGWAHVFVQRQTNRLSRRGYPGWLPLSQLTDADQELAYPTTTVRLVQPATVFTTTDQQIRLTLPMGTILTTTGQDSDRIQVVTPLGSGSIAAQAAHLTIAGGDDGARLLALSRQLLGTPYLWGGLTPQGVDCSGLAYSVHRTLGYRIPRDAQDQFTAGYPIAPEALRPGDLIFFATDHGTGHVHHVGLYAGQGQMLHAPRPGQTVAQTPLTTAPFAAEYAGARRFWQ